MRRRVDCNSTLFESHIQQWQIDYGILLLLTNSKKHKITSITHTIVLQINDKMHSINHCISWWIFFTKTISLPSFWFQYSKSSCLATDHKVISPIHVKNLLQQLHWLQQMESFKAEQIHHQLTAQNFSLNSSNIITLPLFHSTAATIEGSKEILFISKVVRTHLVLASGRSVLRFFMLLARKNTLIYVVQKAGQC